MSSSSPWSLIDKAFAFLDQAIKLEEEKRYGEASEKYQSAVSAFRKYVERQTDLDAAAKQLLYEKIKHYEQHSRAITENLMVLDLETKDKKKAAIDKRTCESQMHPGMERGSMDNVNFDSLTNEALSLKNKLEQSKNVRCISELEEWNIMKAEESTQRIDELEKRITEMAEKSSQRIADLEEWNIKIAKESSQRIAELERQKTQIVEKYVRRIAELEERNTKITKESSQRIDEIEEQKTQIAKESLQRIAQIEEWNIQIAEESSQRSAEIEKRNIKVVEESFRRNAELNELKEQNAQMTEESSKCIAKLVRKTKELENKCSRLEALLQEIGVANTSETETIITTGSQATEERANISRLLGKLASHSDSINLELEENIHRISLVNKDISTCFRHDETLAFHASKYIQQLKEIFDRNTQHERDLREVRNEVNCIQEDHISVSNSRGSNNSKFILGRQLLLLDNCFKKQTGIKFEVVKITKKVTALQQEVRQVNALDDSPRAPNHEQLGDRFEEQKNYDHTSASSSYATRSVCYSENDDNYNQSLKALISQNDKLMIHLEGMNHIRSLINKNISKFFEFHADAATGQTSTYKQMMKKMFNYSVRLELQLNEARADIIILSRQEKRFYRCNSISCPSGKQIILDQIFQRQETISFDLLKTKTKVKEIQKEVKILGNTDNDADQPTSLGSRSEEKNDAANIPGKFSFMHTDISDFVKNEVSEDTSHISM